MKRLIIFTDEDIHRLRCDEEITIEVDGVETIFMSLARYEERKTKHIWEDL